MKRISLLAMLSVAAVTLVAQSGSGLAAPKPVFKPKLGPPAATDFRTIDPENVLVIDTTKGRVFVEMVPEVAPQSVARIKELAREKFYDGLTFHRVVDAFMAQGGDPKGDGSGGSTKPNVPGEFVFRRGPDTPYLRVQAVGGLEDGFIKSLPVRTQNTGLMIMTADGKVQGWGLWCPGVAGMARAGDPNSGNSQFFLMRQFNEGLEHNYTPWGRVVAGLDVVRALKTGEPVVDPDKMTSVRVLADLPAASRPKVQVLDTASPAFQAQVANAESVCDIELPGKVQ
ncbi:MAG: peptidylprolyl isomerase [Caulobacteraceae bacterium]|nr:peptidylprolyl isomerase [Caulobacteraceae bacterium]